MTTWCRDSLRSVALFVVLAGSLGGQQADDIDISQAALEEAKQRIETNLQLTDDQRTALLQRYDQALSAVESAAVFAADATRFEYDEAQSAKLIEIWRDQSPTIRERVVDVDEFESVEQIEHALVEDRAERESRRNEIRNLEGSAARRRPRLSEIATRTGELNHQVVDIDDSLETVDETITEPLLRTAARTLYLAQKRLAEQEIRALEAERLSYTRRAQLRPLRRDRAERRVVEISREIAALRNLALQRSAEESRAYLAEIDRLIRIADEKSPELSDLTSEIRGFAEKLTGQEGVSVKTDEANRQLEFRREQTSQIKEIMRLARRKFDVVGMTGDASQWFPDIPESFPTRSVLRAEIRVQMVTIPDVEHQLIVLEETRVGDAGLDAQLAEWLARLDISPDATDVAEWETLLRGLLTTRRELLDRLIDRQSRYLSRATELAAASQESLAEIESGAQYLVERIVWVRSVPGSMLPSLSTASEGVRWLFDYESWAVSLSHSFAMAQEDGISIVFWLVLLAGLLLLRPWLKKRLRRYGAQASRKDNLVFWPTVASSLVTVTLAIPLPYALALLSRFLEVPQATPVAFAVAQSLELVAILAFALELAVQSVRPRGLAEAHCHWSEASSLKVGRKLRRFMVLFLAVSTVCLSFFDRSYSSFLGLGPEVAFANSIGRIAFIIAMLTVAFWTHSFLRMGIEFANLTVSDADAKKRRRLRYFWLPLLSATAFGLALLAAAGYYLTAFTFAVALFLSALLGSVLFVISSFVSRWTLLRSRQVRFAQRQRQAEEQAASPEGNETSLVSEELVDTEEASQRTSEFMRVSLALVALFGLLAIWSEVLPSLRILERVEIWPEIQLLSEEQAALMKAGGQAQTAAFVVAGSSGLATEAQGAAPSPTLPGRPLVVGSSSEASDSPSDLLAGGKFLSLAGLLLAIAGIGLTIMAARTVPALLDLTVLQRLAMESGDRKAVGTVVQYVIFAFGFGWAASQLGLNWSSIQWLAAAFSFGLAFGLQEIFANFISGLIILLERPMRVGDAVEIGDRAGIVTKIEMRATTITTWSRSEIVVPNKEFITGQLVNWTRSDRRVRVEVPVGVAYGTDIDLVRNTLLEIAARHPDVVKEPEPEVMFTEFGNSSLNFELRVFIDWGFGRLRMGDEMRTEIDSAFRRKGIVIAFPQLDLHMSSTGALPSNEHKDADGDG